MRVKGLLTSILAASMFLFISCSDEGDQGSDGINGVSIEWLGPLDSPPLEPGENQGYYNTNDKTSYLWDGDSWELLVKDGTQGEQGIQGETGVQGVAGADGAQGIQGIQGESGAAGVQGETGPQGEPGAQGAQGIPGTNGINGTNGLSVEWLGSMATEPTTPTMNQGYYNTTDGASYIWDGSGWELFAQDGIQGIQGVQGIQGETGTSGTDGINGISIEWLGAMATDPSNPTQNQAYRNTIDGASYIWDGAVWQLLVEDGVQGLQGDTGAQGIQGIQGLQGEQGDTGVQGVQGDIGTTGAIGSQGIQGPQGATGAVGNTGAQGATGTTGLNGISIEWLGSLATAPGSPTVNQAYHDTTDHASYIWDGDSWELLVQQLTEADVDAYVSNNGYLDAAIADANYLSLDGGTLVGNLHVEGSIQLSDDSDGCDGAKEGTLRYTAATGLEACNGTDWVSVAPKHTGAIYRWNQFSSYSNASGWLANNEANLFGGVAPSNWTDNNAVAGSMSSDSEVLRTLFTRKGFGGKNAHIMSEVYTMYSSTNGRVTVALFRIKNSTFSSINWTPYFFYTCYSSWGERASVAMNGVHIWDSGGTNCDVNNNTNVTLAIPANSTSTVIVTSSSSKAMATYNSQFRANMLIFFNDSLSLPAGLSYADDLDSVTGTLW
jgi:Collagen triple helix repeat (20 copies)